MNNSELIDMIFETKTNLPAIFASCFTDDPNGVLETKVNFSQNHYSCEFIR